MPDESLVRAVFFDRDGTLMEEVHYCKDPALVSTFPGTSHALRALRQRGWKCVLVTNQSGIGRGLLSDSEYHAVAAELDRQLGGMLDATYYCPDTPDQPSIRRKPEIGMLTEAAGDLSIDLKSSIMVGDKASDILCGKNAGCRTILVETGYGSAYKGPKPDFIARDVVDAISLILKNTR